MMRRSLFITVLLLGMFHCLNGQTYYYKLTKKKINGTVTTNVSGGQFVTFMADICFESNDKGFGGTLGKLKHRETNDRFKEYKGESSWGSGVTFRFTLDLSKFNVILPNGDVWAYTRTEVPAGVTACSHLKEEKKPSNTGSGTVGGYYAPIIVNSTASSSGDSYSAPNNTITESSSNSYTPKITYIDVTCSLCKGTGKNPGCSYAPTYGGSERIEYCPICGTTGKAHYHETCPKCGGKGTTRERK